MEPGRGTGREGVDGQGFALVIGSALCYASLGILGKLALAESVPLLSILSLRFTLGALLFWIAVAASPVLRRELAGLPRRRVRDLVLWGVFGFAGQSALFFSALTVISASLSEVLLYTCPAFLALILWWLSGMRPASGRLAAIALAVLGTYLCAGTLRDATDPAGVALALLAGFWYAAFMVWMHRLTPGVSTPLSGALIVSGSAAAFDLAAALHGGFRLPATAAGWGAVLGMVLLATVVGLVLFVAGLNRVGPQVAAVLSTFEPLGTLLLARLILGERLAPAQWAGAALIIGAAFVLAATAPAAPRTAVQA